MPTNILILDKMSFSILSLHKPCGVYVIMIFINVTQNND